ncbi:MAG: response regulator [bacterium]
MEKNKKILLVEDDEGFREAIKESFRDTEFVIITASDGEEGLAKAKEGRPDLILLDILLPKMDGIEMASKLKEAGIKLPIMYLTNVKNDERISDAMSVSGGDMDYIVKTDVRVEDIIDRIRKRLDPKT